MFVGTGGSEETGCRGLDVRKFTECYGRCTVKKAIAVVYSGCDEGMNQGFSGREGEESGKMFEVEECGPG